MVYISNRLESLKDSTLRNGIPAQGLQEASGLHLLLTQKSSDKQDRIRQVEEKYHVVAYLGDNLGDFPGETQQPRDVAEHLAARRKKVESDAELWGTRWFMLPNPVYGDWYLTLPREDGDTFVIKAGPKHEVLATNSVGEPV
ncbi:MAG: hypothetical protein EXQ58_09860 [Acidobacteria bacterium]|nr:hypothetical protein [Acidobacteriota bacterium]